MVIKYLIPLSSPMATLSPLLQKGESKRLVRLPLPLPLIKKCGEIFLPHLILFAVA